MDSTPDAPNIAGFAIQSLLGKGGCGAVYRATQLSLNRPVALKVLLADQLASLSDRRRFQREARLLASLNHPHVMRVFGYGAGDAGEVPHIALELLEGGTLRQRFERGGDSATRKLSLPDVLRLTGELLDALATLHDRNIVHRDIKPANVLFRPNGAAVLSDLGIAKLEAPDETQLTATGVMVGTLAYMPPEAYEKKAPGARGDLYALGVLLFEALTGFRPTHFRPYVTAGAPPDPTRAAPATPPELAALVMAMLAIDPAERPPDARVALQRVAPLLAESMRFAPTILPPVPVEADTSDDESTLVGAAEKPVPPSSRGTVKGPPATRDRTPPALRTMPRQNAAVALCVATGILFLLAAAIWKPAEPVAPAARPRITVHGVEGRGSTRALWVTTGAAPVRLPLDGSGSASLRVAGSVVRLSVPASPVASGPRFADIGLATPLPAALPRLGPGEGAPKVTDWLAQAGLGWLAVLPDEHGTTLVDPAVFAHVAKRTPGLRSIVMLRPRAAPGEGGPPRLDAELDELARASSTSRPIVTFQDYPFDANEETGAGSGWDRMPSMIARWRSYISGRHPQLSLSAPPVWALLSVHVPSPESNPAGRVDTLIVSLLKASRPYWEETLRQLRAAFGDRFSPSHVRWVLAATWLTGVESTVAPQIEELSALATARGYLFARRHFPQATVLLDLPAFIHWRSNEPGRAWRVLEQVAARVSGLAVEGAVPLPPHSHDVTFSDGVHRVHAFLMDTGGSKVASVFQPRRAGVLTRIDPLGRLTSTLVDPPAPVTLPVDASLTFFEELAPAAASSEPPGLVDAGGR